MHRTCRHGKMRSSWFSLAALWICLQQYGTCQINRTSNVPPDASALQAFGVVSVRPNEKHDARWSMQFTSDGYTAIGVTVKQLVVNAYEIYLDGRLRGLSGWTTSRKFDVEAKVDPPQVATFHQMANEQRRRLLINLLSTRFKLVAHEEQQLQPAYSLSLTKDHFKSGKSTGIQPAQEIPGQHGMLTGYRPGRWTGERCTTAQLALLLSLILQRPVIDETKLSGGYNFSLNWDPESDRLDAHAATAPDRNDLKGAGPSLFTALKEQLGLQLKSTKRLIPIWVVDSVQPPLPN